MPSNPFRKKKRTATEDIIDGGAAQTAVAPAPAAVPDPARAKGKMLEMQQSPGGGGATSAQEEILGMQSRLQSPGAPVNTTGQAMELDAQKFAAQGGGAGDVATTSRQQVVDMEQKLSAQDGTGDGLKQQMELNTQKFAAQGGTAQEELLGIKQQQLGGKTPGGIGTTEGKKQFLLESGLIPEGGQSFAEWTSGRLQDQMVRSPEQQRQKAAQDQAAYEKQFGLAPGAAQKQQLALQQEFQRQQGAGGGTAQEDILAGGGVSAAGDPPGSGDIRDSIEDRGFEPIETVEGRTQKSRGQEGTTPERDVGIPGGELTEDQWATAGKDGGTTPVRRRTYTSPNAQPIGESRFSVRDKETGEIIQEGAIEDIFPQHDIFDAPDWLEGESKNQWNDINQQITDLIDGWEGRSEKANREGGGPTSDGTTREMSEEDFRAKSSIEEAIKELQEKQKSIIGTSIPPDQKAGLRGPDGLESTEIPEDQTPEGGTTTGQDELGDAVETNVEEGSAGERLDPDGEGDAGETGGDVTPEASTAESDLGEGTTFSAETSPEDYKAFIDDLGSLASESLLEGATAEDIENLGQNKKVNEFLDKVMDWDPELSSEEKGAIRSRMDKGIQAAVSKLSGAGMGLSSGTVKAIAQGEIMFELEVARAQDNLRTEKLQAALNAAGIETGREKQRAENVFTFEGQELNRDVANQNFYAVTQSQKLEEVKNDQGNTLAERAMEIKEDYLALDEKKQEDMLKQFEAEFGLTVDKTAFDQMIEKGEFDLSVIDSDRMYQLQATQQINDFMLKATDLEIQDKLGMARIDLEAWVAGERIDLDTVSNAIRRMAVNNQHDVDKAKLEVMLAEIEAGGETDWLNFTADLLPVLGFVFGGPPGAAAGGAAGAVADNAANNYGRPYE